MGEAEVLGRLPLPGKRTNRLRRCRQGFYSPECVERLYEKSSNTGEPPRHEADHGSVHQRLAART